MDENCWLGIGTYVSECKGEGREAGVWLNNRGVFRVGDNNFDHSGFKYLGNVSEWPTMTGGPFQQAVRYGDVAYERFFGVDLRIKERTN